MAVKVGINGFGRIGRLAFRAMVNDPDIEVVAVNDLGSIAALAHLLKYDSNHGRAFKDLKVTEEGFIVAGREVKVLNDREPANLPWGELGVEVVVESTGVFTDAEKAKAHLEAGAKKVLITEASDNADITLVYGVNVDSYDPEKHHIISGSSCAGNALAPIAKVLFDEFGFDRGYMNTIHAYANDQKILDLPHKDHRRARAAAMSMIPLANDCARTIDRIIPELEGKMDGFITRVPVQDGSMLDLTAELGRAVTIEEVNAAIKAAAEGPMEGVLEYTEDPIVSIDVVGEPVSATFDSKLTMVMGGESNMVKVVAWYDNEWGYASRVKDLVKVLL